MRCLGRSAVALGLWRRHDGGLARASARGGRRRGGRRRRPSPRPGRSRAPPAPPSPTGSGRSDRAPAPSAMTPSIAGRGALDGLLTATQRRRRQPPGQHLVEDDAQRVVHPRPASAAARPAARGRRRPDRAPGGAPRRARAGSVRARPSSATFTRPALFTQTAAGLSPPWGMEARRALEAVGDVRDQVACALERHAPPLAPLAVDELPQRLPVEQLGGDEEEVGLSPDVQDLDQVLVDERARLLDVRLELGGAVPSTRMGMIRRATAPWLPRSVAR